MLQNNIAHNVANYAKYQFYSVLCHKQVHLNNSELYFVTILKYTAISSVCYGILIATDGEASSVI